LARLRFQAGVGTQTDRLNAETRLTRARGNVLIAIIGYNRALAALNRAVSNLPPGTIQPVPEPIQLPELIDAPTGPTTP
jgi:outer membrane protein TolC